LCSVLPVTRVYTNFADVLIKMKDFEFISNMINILDIFLLTHKETEGLRVMLRQLRKKTDKKEEIEFFFEKIYTTWSFNPISTLILCFVSEFFELSYHLILKFADLKLEQEYFIQLSQLVQLIESSVFNNIRVLLLEPIKNIYLVKTLYGILMLLPQGKAYQALTKRLKSVEMLCQIDNDLSLTPQNNLTEINQSEIEYFLKIFTNTQLLLKK
jgi:vacuole morphology and inheritance protein 14